VPEKELVWQADRFQVVRHRFEASDGTECSRMTIRHPGAVVLLPLLPGGRVCLIRNRRIAVEKTLIELPAGTLTPGENPAEAALRELAEETGYRAGRLEPLYEFYVSPGIMNERMYLYLASELTPGPLSLELDEKIEPLVVEWSRAMSMVDRGEIEDAKTLFALLYYDRLLRSLGEHTIEDEGVQQDNTHE